MENPDTKKVAIITPTYNRIEYLKKAINSVINQTFTNWTMIIINDGGEKIEELVESFKDDRINIINLDKNHNDYGATPRNTGLDYADKINSDLIAYLDDDNNWEPNHLKELVDIFIRKPEIEFAFSSSNVISKQNGKLIKQRMMPRPVMGGIDTSELMHKRNKFRWKKIGHKYSPHKAEYGHDWDFVAQMLRSGARWEKNKNITVNYYYENF